MNEFIGFTICIEATDAYMNVGPVFTNKPINNSLIETVIRDVLTENNQTNYSTSDIEEIIVVGIGDTFDIILQPKIEDVWPSEFGTKNNTRKYWKGGDKD